MSNRNFEKGQYIVYATNGLCRIEDVQDMSFITGAAKKKHYIIKPVKSNSSTIYIPADNVTLMSKVRPAMTKENIDALLSDITEKEIVWENDRKIRAEKFHDILVNGVSEDLLLMIICIYMQKQELLKTGKTLSSADKRILESAEKLVEEEFSFALDIKSSEVGKYIHDALDA